MEEEMTHVSNYDSKVNVLSPGVYGLSNALLDTPWPKVTKAKDSFNDVIKNAFTLEDLIGVMQNTELAKDDELPETGIGYEWEKAISAMCIQMPEYGTCCTTAITISYDGEVNFMEKSYPVGDRKDQTVSHSFLIEK